MVSVQEAKDAIRTLNVFCGERSCSDCELASVYTEMDCEALTCKQHSICMLTMQLDAEGQLPATYALPGVEVGACKSPE